jgi:hypothetical protein
VIPSFRALFGRSKYEALSLSSEDEEPANNSTDFAERRDIRQRERFGVAAIAFCAEHNGKFKKHFIANVWKHAFKSNLPERSSNFSIDVEPRLCADLVFTSPTRILVIEHKIDADLQPHQDPRNNAFIDPLGTPKGYGVQLSEEKRKSGKYVFYAVLGKARHAFAITKVNSVECGFVEWSQLRQSPKSEGPLTCDLYDCLGFLGVSDYALRSMKKNEKLGRFADKAALTYEMLRDVCDKAGLKAGKMGAGDTGWAANDYSFGIPIFAGASGRLTKLMDSSERKIGWIGYEKRTDEKEAALIIYLHCGSEAGRKDTLRKLRKLRGVRNDGNDIVITCPVSASTGDREWFSKILRQLANRTPG